MNKQWIMLWCALILSGWSAITDQDREEYIRYGFEKTLLGEFKLERNPIIFISYAWGGDTPQKVQRFGYDLKRISTHALLDIEDNPPSTTIVDFISQIRGAHHILLFGSEEYKRKWDQRSTYKSVLVTEAEQIYEKSRRDVNSVLGVHIQGERRENSFPEFMEPAVTVDGKGDYYATFKTILKFLWEREQKEIGEFNRKWEWFDHYKKDVMEGKHDDGVNRNKEFLQHAQQRDERVVQKIKEHQLKMRTEEEAQADEEAARFLV